MLDKNAKVQLEEEAETASVIFWCKIFKYYSYSFRGYFPAFECDILRILFIIRFKECVSNSNYSDTFEFKTKAHILKKHSKSQKW